MKDLGKSTGRAGKYKISRPQAHMEQKRQTVSVCKTKLVQHVKELILALRPFLL